MSDLACIHGRFTERQCEECEADARAHQHCKDPQKLITALRELEGFARRNVERAKKAMAHFTDLAEGCEDRGVQVKEGLRQDLMKAEARFHEASRVYMTIKMRVAEALQ